MPLLAVAMFKGGKWRNFCLFFLRIWIWIVKNYQLRRSTSRVLDAEFKISALYVFSFYSLHGTALYRGKNKRVKRKENLESFIYRSFSAAYPFKAEVSAGKCSVTHVSLWLTYESYCLALSVAAYSTLHSSGQACEEIPAFRQQLHRNSLQMNRVIKGLSVWLIYMMTKEADQFASYDRRQRSVI